MLRIVAALLVCFVGAAIPAQERPATVAMEDGRVLEGTVVGIDLGSLQLRVGDEVLTLPTASIRTCQFAGDEVASPAADAAQAGSAAAGSAANQPPAVQAPSAPAAGRAPKTRGPLPDPIVPGDEAAVPHDLRHRSRFRARLYSIDEAFPWLVPTEPTQWISLGLLLFACLSLVVHISVVVVGAEAPGFGRSMAISLWYLLTGLLQMAMVPSVHVATFIMLIGNTAMALFWLRNLFAVSRGGAMISFAVQLGFVVLGWGVLELVNSLMASIEPLPV